MALVIWMNGEARKPEDARVPVLDRGFLYGDSVYEVLRVYGGVPFALEAHSERLYASARRIGMSIPVPANRLAQELSEAVAAYGGPEAYARIVCTRGAGPIGLDPDLAVDPQRIVVVQDLNPPPPTLLQQGVEVALVSVRRNLKQAIDPQAKTGNYLNSVLAVAEAKARGAYEAVMLDHQDYVTEGASSNIFAVVGGVVLTPPVSAGILEGVTRTVVMEVAAGLGRRVIEVPLTAEVLMEADELFLTSSIREVVPIVRVDDRSIGAGVPGPVYQELRDGFDRYVAAYVEAHRDATG